MSSAKNDFVRPIAVLTIICLVISAALVFTYQWTKPTIDATAAETARLARIEVYPGAGEMTELTEGVPEGVDEVYVVDGGAGYIITLRKKGYGGDITIMAGVTAEGEVTGLKVLSNSESPGKKEILDDPEYLANYIGKSNVDDVATVSGATVSSSALKAGVKDIIAAAQQLSGNAAPADPMLPFTTAYPGGSSYEPIEGDALPQGIDEGYVVDGGPGVIYVATVEAYGGPMRVMAGVREDGTLAGVYMLEHHETEGYGSKVAEPDYLLTYTGTDRPEDVANVSGATSSSGTLKSVLRIILDAYQVGGAA